MTPLLHLLLCLILILVHVNGFCPLVALQRSSNAAGRTSTDLSVSSRLPLTVMAAYSKGNERKDSGGISRKSLIEAGVASLLALPWLAWVRPEEARAENWFGFGPPELITAEDTLSTVGKVTPTGVKYYDYKEGTGPTPEFGQSVVMRYVLYGQLNPSSELVMIDKSDNNKESYLIKHGNGRQIKGMEEGLHTMRVGGKRRILIPPSLAYIVPGLGPFPASWINRRKLNEVLDAFEAQQTATGRQDGVFVMDVQMIEAFDDEADQGYYQDRGLTIEEIKDFTENTQRLTGQQRIQMQALPGTNPMETMDAV